MTDATSVQTTPPTKPRFDASDLEDTLTRATNMAAIAVMLLEKALDVYAHYGDVEYHEKRRKEGYDGTYFIHKQDEEILLWTIYETHAQIHKARDLYCGT